MRRDTDAVDDIARMLEAAAAEAPPSPRMELLRSALLDSVPSRRFDGLLAPLAVAAVVLLGVLLAVGAPAVGTMIVDMLDRAAPAPALPEPTDGIPPTDTDARVEVPGGPSSGKRGASSSSDAALDAPGNGAGDDGPPAGVPPVTTPRPGAGDAEPEPTEDAGPPMPVPSPPAVIPPPSGPPSGVPAP